MRVLGSNTSRNKIPECTDLNTLRLTSEERNLINFAIFWGELIGRRYFVPGNFCLESQACVVVQFYFFHLLHDIFHSRALLSSWPSHRRGLLNMSITAYTRGRNFWSLQAFLIVGIVHFLCNENLCTIAEAVLEKQRGSTETIVHWVLRNGGQVQAPPSVIDSQYPLFANVAIILLVFARFTFNLQWTARPCPS